jgi:hypothetical protein
MALVVLGAGVLALLLREPVQRLMRVERAVDPLTSPAGPGAGLRGGTTTPFSPTRWEPHDR